MIPCLPAGRLILDFSHLMMLIFIYGEDSYRSHQKLNEIVAHYQQTHSSGLSLKYFNVDRMDYSEFKDQIRQSSIFTKKKLAVVKNSFSDKSFQENFLEDSELWEDPEDIILFYEDDKVDKRTSLFKFLKNNAQWEQFELLTGNQLEDWVAKQLDSYEVDISSKARSTLIDFVGSDLWCLSNEIKKLVSYTKDRITVEDVKLLVKPKLEIDIFETIDAFALKNKRKALDLVRDHLEKGDSPLYILHMINYQLRNLLVVKQLTQQGKSFSAIKKETELHPFVVKKTLSQSRNFSLEEIKKIYRQLFKVDLNIKTGKVEPEPALKSLIARF